MTEAMPSVPETANSTETTQDVPQDAEVRDVEALVNDLSPAQRDALVAALNKGQPNPTAPPPGSPADAAPVSVPAQPGQPNVPPVAGSDTPDVNTPPDDAHVTPSGKRVWVKDGRTYVEDANGTQHSVDGDVSEAAVAVATLFQL